MQKEKILMVCPNEEKMKILENTTNDKELNNIKLPIFMKTPPKLLNISYFYDNILS